MNKTALRSMLRIEVPPSTLVKQGSSTTVDLTGLVKPSTFSCALNHILNVSDAHRLVGGLDTLLGGASQYAVTGSVALALHGHEAGVDFHREPGDLDVVVSADAMDQLGERTTADLALYGLAEQPGHIDHLQWTSVSGKAVKVDLVSAKNSPAGQGLASPHLLGEHGVVPLDVLQRNLTALAQLEHGAAKHQGDEHFAAQLLARQTPSAT